jgi:hypothetical protein
MTRRGPDRRCYRQNCARCEASGPFAPHDIRQRGLRIVIEAASPGAAANQKTLRVRREMLLLVRWRCRKCRRLFTDHPDFRTPL